MSGSIIHLGGSNIAGTLKIISTTSVLVVLCSVHFFNLSFIQIAVGRFKATYRLYDANYNIGESYYKSALDRLDRKYSGRPLSPTPRNQFSPTEAKSERQHKLPDEEEEKKAKKGKIISKRYFIKCLPYLCSVVVQIKTIHTFWTAMRKRMSFASKQEIALYKSNNMKRDGLSDTLHMLDRNVIYIGLSENIADRHARIFAEEDIETSRRRAGKHIREQNLFDSRGVVIGRRPVLDNLENDLNDETSAVIRSIRANKKSAVVDDIDLENTSSSLKSSRLLNRSEKILDSVGLNDRSIRAIEEGSYKRRPKVTFETDAEDYQKWTPVDNRVAAVHTRREEVTAVRARKEERSDRSAEIRSESSAAAMRARQSKERLNDLEEEMAVIAEKQAAREARVARLRALVAETEQESEVLERSQTAAERRAARREQLESIE
ncbi:hypothetical protein NQ317_012815 [Molorchus minor]|uniref:Uncharacterized protein n=1 Tax=Molorchus minor TaxID=1323400 RepID=A0ABQ9K6C6_9CUCU|nr:hypothetical protein NQ317_012815 [Molorchus minor]